MQKFYITLATYESCVNLKPTKKKEKKLKLSNQKKCSKHKTKPKHQYAALTLIMIAVLI